MRRPRGLWSFIFRAGFISYDGVSNALKGNTDQKPKYLKNSLKLGTQVNAGNTSRQTGTKYANVNVYSKFLSIDDMISITNGPRCGEAGDYVSWAASEWSIFGDKARVLEVEEETLCPSASESKLFLNGHLNAEKAGQFCERLGKPLKKSNMKIHK